MSIAAQAIHGARVCVIPDPDNDFRPLALRHRPLALVSTLLLAVKLIAMTTVALVPQTADLATITSTTIVNLTNAERKKAGVSTLAVSPALTSAAQQKAQDMLEHDYFAHISPSGVTPWFWMAKVGYTYEMAGENLAIDFTEAEDVVAAWLASPSHRDNMLQAGYTETGVAVATGEFQGGTSTVVVHMFGRPPGVAASSPAPTSTGKAAGTQAAPTPSATPTPAPSPTPLPVPADTTPPRVPRIAVATGVTTVKNEVEVTLQGEAGSRVSVLVNNQLRTVVTMPEAESAPVTLALSHIPDGPVVVRAYATDVSGNVSDISEPTLLAKDTVGPVIEDHALAFLLGSRFDAAVAAVRVPPGVVVRGVTDGWTVLSEANGEFTIVVQDEFGNATELPRLTLAPHLASDFELADVTAPARAQVLARRVAMGVAAALLVLLLLAILIHIRVQRFGLIVHTSLVILLALALWIA